MSASTLISLEEYLNSSYYPDMEFVDGVLLRRNVGTQLHSWLQAILVLHFGQFQKTHCIRVLPEARLLVDRETGRHRIPDVMVLSIPYQKGRVVIDVPVLVVEIKSPDDTFDEIVDKCFDYEALGVPHIVVMDPENKRGWSFIHGSLELLIGNSMPMPVPSIDFPFAEMFAELDT